MKILIVDDDRYILEVMAFMLRSENLVIELCASVDDAIAAMEKDTFALIITDIVMPEKMGTKLAQHARKVSPSIPILAITAGIENALEDYMHLGDMFADETMAKPIKKAELIGAIRRLTGT